MGRRRASFSVRSPRGGAPQILSTLASLLEAQGGAVAVDQQGFALRAQMPPHAVPADNGSGGLEGSMRGGGEPDEACGGIGNSDEVCKSGHSNREGADEDGTSAGMPRKRQKKSGVLNSTDEGVTGLDPGAYELQIKLMQESKTACVATASIATSVLDEDAGRFTMLCKMLETDLAQMLG